MPKSSAILNPNLGLYLDRTHLSLPKGALQDGNNFRIQQGKLTNFNMGWERFGDFILSGPVTLITTFHLRSGQDILMFGTTLDLYAYNSAGGGSVRYITPIYSTGTAAASGTTVTGTGTAWNTGSPTNAKAGDFISFGANDKDDPNATWYEVASVTNDTELKLTTSAGTVADGPYTIRKTFSGTVAKGWQYDVFVNAQPASEDRIYLTNGIDAPVQWNGVATQCTVLNSLGFSCTTLVVYKNMLIYGNLTQGGTFKPSDMINSDVSKPEEIVSGLAGQFKVSGTPDEITRLTKLGDYLIIYLQKPIIVANFVGDPLVFVFRTAVEEKGLVSPNGLARFPDYHEFLGPDALYVFDGTTAKPVSNHVWRDIIRTMDPVRRANVFTVLDEHRGDYIWAVPLTTDAGAGTDNTTVEHAYVEHYLEIVPQGAERPHSKRSFPFTASGYYQRQNTLTWDQLTAEWASYNFRWNDRFLAAQFPNVIVGDIDGKVWTLNASQNKGDGTGLISYATFGRMPTADGRMRALLARVYPFLTTLANNVNITVTFADHAAGAAAITATAVFDSSLPEGLYFAPIYRVGRYFDLTIGSNGPDEPWELSGYDYEVRPGGYR